MHRLLLFGGLWLHDARGRVLGRAAQRRRLALLALLAVEHPRPVSRDKLVALLWPESDGDRARNRLRQTLHLLRATLGEEALLSHGDELRLDPARLDCDLWDFRDALARGELEAAVAACTAPFLDGVYLTSADEFERWVETERARLARSYGEALEGLAERCEAAGDPRAAVAWWWRLAEHDPFSSRVALRLMQALEATGDRAAALRHAEAHAALLGAELGAEPAPELVSLAVALREQSGVQDEPADAGIASPPVPADSTASQDRAAAGQRGPPTASAEREPGDPASVAAPRGAGRARPLQRLVRVPRVQAVVLAGVLVVGLLGTLTAGEHGQRALARLGLGAGASLLGRGVLVEREPLLLADFTSPTADTVLARIATVAFRIDLAQSPILRLVEPQQVQAALTRMQRSDAPLFDAELAREVALREGLKAVVAGEIARSGSGYLVSAKLLAAETGEILTAHREAARDSSALIPALDRLSKQLRRRIGESLGSVQANPPLHQVTTSSLDALRKYSQADQIRVREGNDARVIALLEEAIARDTSFAMAYVKLAGALPEVLGRSARWAESLERAYQLRDRLTDRERYILSATYYLFYDWEPEKAITGLRTLLWIDPHDALALHNLSMAYLLYGDYAHAEEYARRALAQDPTRVVDRMHVAHFQFNQGKLVEAEATYQSVAARFPEFTWIAYDFVNLAAAHGDHATAEQRARAERTAKPENLDTQWWMAQMLADLAGVRGRLRDAERYTLEVRELSERSNWPAQQHFEVLNLARIEASILASPAKALERAERLVEMLPLSELDDYDRPYLNLAALHARAGQPARARALVARWEAPPPTAPRRHVLRRTRPYLGAALPWALGEIALAEGRPVEALQQFRLAKRPSCLICMLPHQARAHEAAAQPDSAIALYERYLRTPFVWRLHNDAEWRGPVLERLGQLHEARGDRARAAEFYAEFIELWRDADPELQPRVREARRRLAALQ